MKTVWKVLTAAAAAAALTPYSVVRDQSTGGLTVRALLWQARYAPKTIESKGFLHIDFLPFGGKSAMDTAAAAKTEPDDDRESISASAEEEPLFDDSVILSSDAPVSASSIT